MDAMERSLISKADPEGPPTLTNQSMGVRMFRPTRTIRAQKPCEQSSFITPDKELFEEHHVGVPLVDQAVWELVIDGLVDKIIVLSFTDLCRLPQTTVTSFHECYGSPLRPSLVNGWKVGNVVWTGVRLSTILNLAKPSVSATYVWSEGLDHGTFAGKTAECYQKDLPITKAMSDEVIVAYKMNGEHLRAERGGPVRLVVPGWFGTNSTKWLCRLSVKSSRAPGIFASHFYNRADSTSPTGSSSVWAVEPNSMIVHPSPGACLKGPKISIYGWAWAASEISNVRVSLDNGASWVLADLDSRSDTSWQRYAISVNVSRGKHCVVAQATTVTGEEQSLQTGRNHVHTVQFEVN
jgi:DMSO/TMAO reductase YedYZ molybdopterin-dependent catalytic subunit